MHICAVMDAFHQNEERKSAEQWQQGNDEGVGKPDSPFCEDIRRSIWGSSDLDLSANQQYYYDQNPVGKYERLCEIKKKYDPSGVFTPNRFCIGLPVERNVPADSKDGRQLRTNPPPPETAEEEVLALGLSGEPQKVVDDKFWKMVAMKPEVGKPVPLWHTWCT
jgi:hypothetical protein